MVKEENKECKGALLRVVAAQFEHYSKVGDTSCGIKEEPFLTARAYPILEFVCGGKEAGLRSCGGIQSSMKGDCGKVGYWLGRASEHVSLLSLLSEDVSGP